MRKRLSDMTVTKMKPPSSGRLEIFDTVQTALAVRITSTGAKSFTVRGRIKGSLKPVRITLGNAGALKLGDARTIAGEWVALMAKGVDPRTIIAAKAAAANAHVVTFGEIAESYITDHVSTLRSAKITESEIRRFLMKPWASKPIASIDDEAIATVIRAIKDSGQPYSATRVLAHCKGIFGWACEPGRGLKVNPTLGLKKKGFKIALETRDVILSDDDLKTVWNAAPTLGAPYSQCIRMLILTGQRLREVAEMSWSEINFAEKVWIIPAARMKGNRAHEVPLTPMMLQTLATLHRGTGPFVFSTTNGKRPISGFSKIKAKLDAKIEATRDNEADPFAAWRFHDLRRTMRTGLGAIPSVTTDVAERVIAHAQSTLNRTYDLHAYRAEKLQALTLWEGRLMGIVNPPPEGNVVRLAS